MLNLKNTIKVKNVNYNNYSKILKKFKKNDIILIETEVRNKRQGNLVLSTKLKIVINYEEEFYVSMNVFAKILKNIEYIEVSKF